MSYCVKTPKNRMPVGLVSSSASNHLQIQALYIRIIMKLGDETMELSEF